MKTAARKNLDRGIRAAWRDSVDHHMPGWLSCLLIMGAALSLCSCGRMDEIAQQQREADEEFKSLQYQLSEVNKEISQVESANVEFRKLMTNRGSMRQADYDNQILEIKTRIDKLKTEKDKTLKSLDEAREFLTAQQSRRRR